MKKADAIKHWESLPDNVDPLPVMDVIPYKTRGSRYGCCGIRIDGSPEFIDAVLSNLKTLLGGENIETRLELSRAQVKPQPGRKAGENSHNGAEVCYIRLHERGDEGKIMQARYGIGLQQKRKAAAAIREAYAANA